MPPLPPQKIEYPKYVDSLWCIYIVSVLAAFNAEFSKYFYVKLKICFIVRSFIVVIVI